MKKFKKVVPALCALLVSAVMLGSSTYAWFSMNTRVTAQGMQVTAQSNSTYLVVSSTNTLATETNVNVTEKAGGIGGGATNVYPCAKADKDIATTDVKAGEWYYASSKLQNNAGAMGDGVLGTDTMNVTRIGTDLTNDYKVTYTFYIGVSAESVAKTANIKIDAADTVLGSSAEWLDKGLCAIVTIEGKTPVTITKDATSGTVNGVELTNTAKSVTVVVYIDGNNTNVTSAKVADLANLQLKLALSIA